MKRRIISPYENAPANQFKGNLHTHTTDSDGPLSPQDTVDAYDRRGYDFLMISDHDTVTDIASLDARNMTLLSGNEITSNGMHLLHVNAGGKIDPSPERQQVINAVNQSGGFVIVNHPNWGEDFVHCSQEAIEKLTGFVGMEIYNGVSLRVEGGALATERWDMLLSKGRRVWGFGNDDPHIPEDYGVAWNMVFAEGRRTSQLIEAMRSGCFYVSTGVRIDAIEAEGRRLRIRSADTECFRVYRDHGRMLTSEEGRELNYELPDCDPLTYVRVECHGFGARMAWTQPFFVE
ncbi:MAG TPA: phosphoesterase [Candidatus Hydrogenedentes bacterium]|nr:phosphoesterase [Candidatus Hydrogenedentota bacterium]